MQAAQRTALRSARRLRPQVQRQSRRFESHDSHSSHAAHDSPAAPVNESFGSGFYIVLAAFPLSIAAYKLTSGGENIPYPTRMITETYDSYAQKWAARNDIHTQALEQAGRDRLLFLAETDRNPRTVELKFTEQFNTGSPWNVPAGQGHINLDKVIAKYQNEAFEANEKKLEQVRTNTVPVEQPFKPLAKSPPGVGSA